MAVVAAGLARVIAREHGGLWGGIADGPAALVAAELRRPAGEDWVRLGGGARTVARLRRRPRGGSWRPRRDATYLVTGAGALGGLLAEWLRSHGAGRVVVASRSSATRVDMTDAELVRGLVDGLDNLKGVFHLAGILDDGLLAGQDWPRFARVLAPKALGAWHLHEATRHLELDAFVLFASAAGVLGAEGQGNYAAANALLDGLARWRHAQGLPGLALDWGAWADVGMAAGLPERERQRLQAQGLRPLTAAEAFAALEAALASGQPQAVVLAMDWSRQPALALLDDLRPRRDLGRPRPSPPACTPPPPPSGPAWSRPWCATPPPPCSAGPPKASTPPPASSTSASIS